MTGTSRFAAKSTGALIDVLGQREIEMGLPTAVSAMIRHIIGSIIILCVVGTAAVRGQQPTLPLEEILKKAGTRLREYVDAFKELHAEETQKTEEYDDDGLKKRREIVSDLIVYQSPINDSIAVEYRNVRSIDGKAIGGRDKRALQLFENVARAGDVRKELERIDRESRRYDLNSSFYGFTLHQGLPLEESSIRHFRYTVTGIERIDGHEVIAIQYQQISQIPGVINKLSLPRKLAGAAPVYRGRLWLDRETFRLRREEREMTLEHPSLKRPLVVVKHEFNYSESPFGILTPTRIELTSFTRGKDSADGTPELLIGGKVTFEYGPFRRFEVTQDYKLNR